MTLIPIELMQARLKSSRSDSDTAFFHDLLYAGELIIRLTTAAAVAAIEDDRDRHRYRLVHSLVRADGVGEWSRALEDALTGPASHLVVAAAKDDFRVLTERLGSGTWQHEAVSLLTEILNAIESSNEKLPSKVALRTWFTKFAALRNKTRGHGAPTPALCAEIVPALERSIGLLCNENPLFGRPWAYLHRNLSGKYRVISLAGDETAFAHLKTSSANSSAPYTNGVYVYFDAPRRLELVHTNADVRDFYTPNGAFNGKQFELHSLITDDRLAGDAAPYLASAAELPTSETHGCGQLDVVGQVWSNLPPAPVGYVRRPALESETTAILANDRHPIVTLVGRGGIGKTFLTLQMLHQIAATNRYESIVWFSARDIDLLPGGPKTVRPQVLTENDISTEFAVLMGVEGDIKSGKSAVQFMANSLRKSHLGGAILFVFDNFETIRNPVDVFRWLDSNIRLPNKILITTRIREFKADYPITIEGMEGSEANELISRTSAALNIEHLITTDYRTQLIDDSGGHPYVIKIMLGEVADKGALGRPRQLVARKDEVLDALFDRTYSNLSPLASRIFLTLSSWRSLVPQMALEAIVLRDQDEQLDAAGAVDELVRMSLVQRTGAPDGTEFLDVPLTAAVFGLRKLAVSPLKLLIENDVRLLQDIGASNVHTLKHGVQPRIRSLFSKMSARIADGSATFSEVQPMLEFIARSYSPAWLLLADLYEESASPSDAQITAEFVRRFIEKDSDGDLARAAWARLSQLYQSTGDLVGACGAFVRAFQGVDAPFSDISNMANWVNNNRASIAALDETDKRAVFGSLARLLENRVKEASATDLSRLAWLYLHAGDVRRARQVADIGMEREPENPHCQRLIERLTYQ